MKYEIISWLNKDMGYAVEQHGIDADGETVQVLTLSHHDSANEADGAGFSCAQNLFGVLKVDRINYGDKIVYCAES